MDDKEKKNDVIESLSQTMKYVLRKLAFWQVPDAPQKAVPNDIKYQEYEMKTLSGHIWDFYEADKLKGALYMYITLFLLILSTFFGIGRAWILLVISTYLTFKFSLKSATFLKPWKDWKKDKKNFASTKMQYTGRVIGVERELKMSDDVYGSVPEAVYRLRVGFVKDGKLKIITTPNITISPNFSSPMNCVVYEYNGKYLADDFFPCQAALTGEGSSLRSFCKYIGIHHELINDMPGANIAFMLGGETFVANYMENVCLVQKDAAMQILSAANEYNKAIPCLIAPDGEFSADVVNLAKEKNILLIYRKMLRDMDMRCIIMQFLSKKDTDTARYLYAEPSLTKYWTIADMEQRYGIPRQHILSDFEKAGLPKENWKGIGPYVYQSKSVMEWERNTGFVKLISTNDGIIHLP